MFDHEDEVRYQEILKEIKHSRHALRMKDFIQHGRISTYDHCEQVARMCYRINKKFGEKADMRTLLIVAFLHDFYLYDWHEKKLKNKIHGFTHPRKAALNAQKYFHIGERERKMIESHMWPLTIHRLPISREAWILCLADKYVATVETITKRKKNISRA